MKEVFDHGSLLSREALAAQSDDIQSSDAIGAHGRTEVRDVFAKASVPLDDTGITDAQELMKHSATPDEGVVTEMNMTGQHAGIGQDVAIPELHIVSKVNSYHEEVSLP